MKFKACEVLQSGAYLAYVSICKTSVTQKFASYLISAWALNTAKIVPFCININIS